MSTKLYKEIYCNSCKVICPCASFPANKVNEQARAKGWISTGGEDYCPECQERGAHK